MISKEFAGLDFSDKRLNNRLDMILCSLKDNLKASFPEASGTWSKLKGLYRFFSNPKVTKDNIMKTHVENTMERCMQSSVVLVVQDTTTISFKSDDRIEGLGFVNDYPEKIGFLVHNAMALDGESGKPLGILNQQVIIRDKIHDKKESRADQSKRQKESSKWLIALDKTHELLKSHKKVIHVADRESDIYTFINELTERGSGFVIRACQNRYTTEGHLMDDLGDASLKGSITIEIPHKGGRKRRVAEAEVYCKTVEILPPKILNKKGKPVRVNIIRVTESGMHKNKIEWILLTSESIKDLADCQRVIWYYKNRWQIEDFHKGLKTGCSIEERQLGTVEKHTKLLSVFSVFAWHGLLLRHEAKQPDNKRIELSDIQIKILRALYPKQSEQLNAASALRIVAMLGGFIGRKSDGSPGWKTILTGLKKIELIEIGTRLRL